jgi:hypothetical protein
MVEILNFKNETVIKLNAAITNLNAQGILMYLYGRDNRKIYHLIG